MQEPLKPPLSVSIIIATWNSEAHLPKCLRYLSEQTRKDFEIILIDNGSQNYHPGETTAQWPQLDIHEYENKTNRGFAFACNQGAQKAKGKWLAFLNADAFPAPDWLENFEEAKDQFPEAGAFGSYILQDRDPRLIDSVGDIYNINGIAWKQQNNYPVSLAPSEPFPILSPCAAAAFYRRDIFHKLGGFDEDYFSYFEDVDLGFRLNLNGYGCVSMPSLRVRHVGSSSTGRNSDFALYHYHRNQIWTYIKNMPGILFWLYLPLYIIGIFLFYFKYLVNGRGQIVFKGKIDAIKQTGKFIRKRKLIQHDRHAKVTTIRKLLNRNLFEPYLIGHKLRKYNKIHGGSADA